MRPSDVTLAQFARDVYCDDPGHRGELLADRGCNLLVDLSGQAVVLDWGPCRIAVCRGTDSVQDWLRNLSRGLRDWGQAPVFRGDPVPPDTGDDEASADARRRPDAVSGQAHRGFIRALRRLWPGMVDALAEVDPSQRIYVGHSLGGACALLTAYWLPCRRVVTYGAPRVGDGELCDVIGRRADGVAQYEAWLDPVPVVPLIGYEHPHERQGGAERVRAQTWGHSMARYADAI